MPAQPWADDGPAPQEIPAPRRGRLRRAIELFGGPALVVVEAAVFLGVWQLLVSVWHVVNAAVVPPPSDVARALIGFFGGPLWPRLASSGIHWGVGYALAIAGGVLLGVVIGISRIAERMIAPLLRSLYATPWISFLPMLVIWEGFDAKPTITLVCLAGLLPIALTTAAGMRTVDESVVNAARVFGCGWLRLHLKITLPASVPYIFTGIRIGAPIAVIAMLVGELLATNSGLGNLLATATGNFRLDQAIATIVVLVVLSAGLLAGFGWAERWLSRWQEDEDRRR